MVADNDYQSCRPGLPDESARHVPQPQTDIHLAIQRFQTQRRWYWHLAFWHRDDLEVYLGEGFESSLLFKIMLFTGRNYFFALYPPSGFECFVNLVRFNMLEVYIPLLLPIHWNTLETDVYTWYLRGRRRSAPDPLCLPHKSACYPWYCYYCS